MMQTAQGFEGSTGQLRKRLFLYLATALFLLSFCLTSAVSYTLYNHLKRAQNDSLAHLAEIRSMAITEWCRRAKDLARQITSRTRIRQELEKYNTGDLDLQQLIEFTRPKLQDAMNLSAEVVGILRLDAKNQIVTDCGYGSNLVRSEVEISTYISDAIVLSNPIAVNTRPLIIVSAPIVNRQGGRQGTDLVIIDLALLKQIVSSSKALGETNQIFVGYRSNNTVFDLFQTRHPGAQFLPKSDQVSAIKDGMAMAIQGDAGLVQISKMALAYHPIAECDWGLAVTQNQSELYSPIYKEISIIGGLSIAIYITFLLGFWFLLKPMAGRILMHADELERKIQEKTEVLEQEIVERKKAEQEKELIITDLRAAMQKIKTLSGMLPICSNCKKIRDDKGYWNQIESYISQYSKAEFSHGICPECAKMLYPELDI